MQPDFAKLDLSLIKSSMFEHKFYYHQICFMSNYISCVVHLTGHGVAIYMDAVFYLPQMTVTWTSGYDIHEAVPLVEWGLKGDVQTQSPAGTLTYFRNDMCGK